ncbi:cache domain-containing protein [Rhizobium sp. RAF56]|uniref:cache domain-containing protein n=1 Tax=Rhizobium sp. RAF56 TaxID=3233062 RepID=UPI003F9E9B1E
MNDAPADGHSPMPPGHFSHPQSSPAASWRAGSYLNLFAAGLILPILLFAFILAWFYVSSEQNRAIDRARSASREMAAAVDHLLSGPRLVLQQLAASTALREGDILDFHDNLSQAARLLGHDIALTVPGEARPMVSTTVPGNSELPELDKASLAYEMQAVESKAPVVSNLIQRNGSDVIALFVPVVRNSRAVYVLSIDLPASQFLAALSQVDLERGWLAGLTDGNGHLIARTLQHAKFVGHQTPPEWLAQATGADGVWTGTNIEGTEVAAAYVRSAKTGWTTAVTVPLSILRAPLWRASSVLLAIGGTLVACAIAFT